MNVTILGDGLTSEERFIALGRSQKEQTLFVVHCYRIKEDEEEIIRIISARQVTKFEKKSLE